MKTAVVFILVALSCCFDVPAASKTHGKRPRPAQSPISSDCIVNLLKSSLPDTLMRLQEMLCLFSEAEKTKNADLYREFLTALHQLLKDAGCTVDQLLKLEDVLKNVGDQLGVVCRKIVEQVLGCVEDLGLSKTLFNVLCQLAGDLLIKLSDALKGLDLKIVTGLTSQINIGGKVKIVGIL
ncbi:uncharacterized protein LOC120932246 isoform X2 [Rana temporaria]|uniref:uncharacterized protein LOC120932246 isoform X2 n=1 Tax=Rana temporaria TaxID=8407 RepID=UPI001AAC5976|nr:uncharacterized protein LOC120932246 isoform X2 [Rana temporaria]